ncbi:MAG: 4Fe-4S dicluster domain-containing protein [Deltaproteobacteria bacterium]|nr:4Fe-4S dicluster domain-containing protein [Deltaproteobacteria bacterium]
MVKLIVDEKEIQAEQGKSVLQACLENGIFIPNLCFMKTRTHPHASCRLCFVEIDDIDRPVASCAEKVREGLVVRTDTQPVRRLQRASFKLLMSVHHCDAKVCPVKGSCQLIRTAKHLKVGLNPRPLELLARDVEEEVDLTFFTYYPFRCVLCGKCVDVCRKKNDHNLLTFAKRGIDTVIAFIGSGDPADFPCHHCGACAAICPTGALVAKSEYPKAAAGER